MTSSVSVDVSGNTAVVGVHFDDDHGTNSGSVYVFEKQANEEWTEVQKLTASDAQPWDLFGGSVAIDGDRLVIGAIGDESRGAARESVYIFERSANGEWLEVDVFNASSGQSTDAFGTSVAVCGDHVFVGAPGAMSDGLASGAAYMYSHSEGNLWTARRCYRGNHCGPKIRCHRILHTHFLASDRHTMERLRSAYTAIQCP